MTTQNYMSVDIKMQVWSENVSVEGGFEGAQKPFWSVLCTSMSVLELACSVPCPNDWPRQCDYISKSAQKI